MLCRVVALQCTDRGLGDDRLYPSVDCGDLHADLWDHRFDDGLVGSDVPAPAGEKLMSVLFIALPLAILLGAAGLFACLYCIRSGQYDDLDSESYRILVDQQPGKSESPEVQE